MKRIGLFYRHDFVKVLIWLPVLCFFSICCYAQQDDRRVELSLANVISMATDSSLKAFIAENMYLAGYWQYRTYKAEKLPFLNFSSTPVNFSRTVKREFNSLDTSYQYVEVQDLTSQFNLSLSQNITQTGGKVYIDSDIGRLENINSSQPVQYSAVPVRVGLNQPLFGFNRFKWESKIEPLKFEQAKKQLVQSMEDIAVTAVGYFFDLAKARINLQIAAANYANADTLYDIGKKRLAIAAISREDVYTLELELINSENAYYEAQTQLKRARMKLGSFLRLDDENDISVIVPSEVPSVKVDPFKVFEMTEENSPRMLDFKRQDLESARDVEEAKKENRFNASLSASFGLNQRGNDISEAYRNPMDQELAMVSLNIPIIDWGLARGRYNLAQKNRDVLLASLEQAETDFKQDVIMTAEEFNLQENLVKGAARADTIARDAYEISKQRFMIGHVDVTKLMAVQNSNIAAQKAYINALEQYWTYYYTLRKLSLYDFEKNQLLIRNLEELIN